MAVFEIVLAPAAEEAPVVDHNHTTESVDSPNNEKASPSHKYEQEHRDTNHGLETEGLSDVHAPNVYVEAGVLTSSPLTRIAHRLDQTLFPLTPTHPRRPTN